MVYSMNHIRGGVDDAFTHERRKMPTLRKTSP